MTKMKKRTHTLKRILAVCLAVLMLLSVAPLGELSGLLPKLDFDITAKAAGETTGPDITENYNCDTQGHSFTGWYYGNGVYYRICNACDYTETKSRSEIEVTYSWDKSVWRNGSMILDHCYVNALTSSSAQFYARFVQNNNYQTTATETGYYLGTSENNIVKQSAKQTNVLFNNQTITGLTPNTVYYFKVYYKYGGTEYQSNVGWFKTNIDPANKYSQNDTAVSNGQFHIHQARFITQTSAHVSAQIAIDQRYPQTIYGTGIKIGTSESSMVEYIRNNSNNADGKDVNAMGVGFQIGDGANDYVGKLICNTKYYYQLFYFTNEAKTQRVTSKTNWFITDDHDYGRWIDDQNGTTHTKHCRFYDSHTVTEDHHFGDWYEVVSATCTEQGMEQRVCPDCGCTETRNLPALDHDWGDWTDNGDGTHTRICKRDASHVETASHTWGEGKVKVYPTCTEAGSKEFFCTVCGAAKPETEIIPALGHTTELSAGDIVFLGSYPQTKVTDEALLSSLNSLDLTWKSYGYFTGTDGKVGTAQRSDYMKYADVTFEGEKYRAVTTSIYRDWPSYRLGLSDEFHPEVAELDDPEATFVCYDSYYRTEEEFIAAKDRFKTYYGYDLNTVTWYKYEPLTWKILDPETGIAICTSAIDAQPFNEKIYMNPDDPNHIYGDESFTYSLDDYSGSSIRRWLNADFYETAFSSEDKTQIESCSLQDNIYHNSAVVQERTLNDNVFLLSIPQLKELNLLSNVDVNGQDYDTFLWEDLQNVYRNGLFIDDTMGIFPAANQVTDYATSQGGFFAYESPSEFVTLMRGITKEDGLYVCLGSNSFINLGDAEHEIYSYVLSIEDHAARNASYFLEGTNLWGDNVALLLNDFLGIAPAIRIDPDRYANIDPSEPTCTEPGRTAESKCQRCGEILTASESIDSLGHDWDEWIDNGDDHLRTCKRCALEETADHVWNDGVVTKVPTCKEQGSKLFTCTVCGATKTEPIAVDPANHADYGTHLENASAATCLEAGYTGDTVCNGCSETLTEGEVIDPLGHAWDEWIDNGDDHTRTCSRCYEEEFADHAWNESEITRQPTAETAGEMTYTCTVCGAIKTEPIPAKGWTVTFADEDDTTLGTQTGATLEEAKGKQAEPTKEADAQYTYTFDHWDQVSADETAGTAQFKAVYTETLNSYTVTFNDEDGTELKTQTVAYGSAATAPADPSKADDENKHYEFSGWDNDFSRITGNLTVTATYTGEAHISKEVVTVPATCTGAGEKEIRCEVCSRLLETQTIDPLGHDWGAWSASGDEHIRTCRRDANHVESEAHAWTKTGETEADCTNSGSITYICDVCAAGRTETVDPKGHTLSKIDAVAPLCLTAGNSAYYTCTVCEKFFSDENAQNEIAENSWILPALGHDWDEWIDNGDDHTRTCSRCYEEEFADHAWNEGEITRQPTAETAGEMTYTCTVCGAIKTEPIPAKGWTVTFADEDDTTLGTQTGATLEEAKGKQAEPTKEADAQYTYTFDHWDQVSADEAAGTAQFKAVYTETLNSYTVTFNDEDGTELKTQTVAYGSAATAPADPSKADDENRHYAFSGWDNDFSRITGNLTVTATYTGEAHISKEVVTVPATCTGAGEKEIRCEVCSRLLETQTIDPLGHDWGAWKTTTEPTVYSGGEETRTCKRDPSHKETRETDPVPSFEVTFVVGEETVQTVRAAKGTKYVEEPDLTAFQQDNKTVVWEEYTLNDEDITIHAIITEIDPNEVADKIDTEKTVDQFENGNATITLSASSPSRLVKFESSSTKPVDVIMVLDLSGSMDEKMGNQETKMQALKNCTNTFLNALNENAAATGADHRVALVGFASGEKVSGYSMTAYENTGLIVTQDGGFVSYKSNNINNSYAKAWMPTGDALGVDARLTAAVNGLTAGGSTNTQLGLKMAQNILSTSSGDGREKIVLLITDGVPTVAGIKADEIRRVAPLAVTYANEIKNLGVKLYTVGVDADADENASFTSAADGVTVKNGTTTFDFNRFLNIVSSNYPGARAMNDYGTKQNSGYYMSVNHTDQLEEIFTKVLYSSVYKKLNFQRCTLVDTLSKDFVLTMEQEQALKDNLAQQYNLSEANVMVRRNADGTTTLRIVGVPAVKCTENGKIVYRASVSFEAALAKYQAGEYATNTEDAYVEVDGERAASFDVPEKVTLNADRNIVVFTLNGTVYRIEEGNLGDVITAPVSDLAKWNIPEGTEITSSYTVFEADDISTDTYTVTWSINGTQTTESYHFGDAIRTPEVADLDDLAFSGFMPWVPATMPARNMTFTATYAPKHTHAFAQTVVGNCKTDLRIVKTCACGETVVEAQPAREHQFSAVVDDLEGNTLTDTLVCSVCGASEQHTLTFQTVKSTWGGTTVLDLSLEKAGTVIQPAAGSTIKIMVPWTNQGYTNTNVRVIRVNEQGVQKTYTATIENGYLVFYADHFSIYLVEELDAQGQETEQVSYKAAVCTLNGTHSYIDTVTPPTCKEKGYTTHTCASCGDTYTDNETAVDSANHADYGFRVVNAKAATCKADGYTGDTVCNGCGATLQKGTVISKVTAQHSLTHINAKAATTEAEGNVEYYHCEVCGKNFSDANGTAELTKVSTDKLQKPTEPEKPEDSGSKPKGDCKYCGETHTGPFGWLIKLIHSILALFGLHK